MRKCLLIGVVLGAVFSFSPSRAEVPTSMNIQGRLTDSAGAPLPVVARDFTFKIFDDEVGGIELWPNGAGETQSITADEQGLWTALIGSMIPLSDIVFSDTVRWLEISVSDGVRSGTPLLLPRVRLVTGPFAYRVATVDGATGGNITSKLSIGSGHTNTGVQAFVAGQDNAAAGDWSTIAGGQDNRADSNYTTVSGGHSNEAIGAWSTIAGGDSNSVRGRLSTVCGGRSNTVSGWFSTIGGGEGNDISGYYSTIGGGTKNSVSWSWATVAGGDANVASEDWSTVGGGNANTASGSFSNVDGGFDNTANGLNATVGGGSSNLAGSDWATVAGGHYDTANGAASSVCGGSLNKASGGYAIVLGGQENRASGFHSLAAGHRANATHDGSFVWGDSFDGGVYSSAKNQFTARASGGARFFSDTLQTTGVTLAPGGGAWAAVSDRSVKENIRPVDGAELLDRIAQLEVSRWNYRTQDPSIEHIGPMAQDFYRLFGVGDNDQTITTIDPDGIALAAIKALWEKNRELETEITELRTIVQDLQDTSR